MPVICRPSDWRLQADNANAETGTLALRLADFNLYLLLLVLGGGKTAPHLCTISSFATNICWRKRFDRDGKLGLADLCDFELEIHYSPLGDLRRELDRLILLLERIILLFIITVFCYRWQAGSLADRDRFVITCRMQGGRKRRELGKLELESLSFTACGVV